MRLLIAEDECDLAEALSVFFEKNQFTVDTVCNGFDAYEYAVTGDYDAIVLDVMMPKLSGVEVLERLRAEGVRTPVMLLSAERILERVWGWDSDAEINVVWVHISNLRKKLKGIGSCVTIRANRGLGYVLEAGDD